MNQTVLRLLSHITEDVLNGADQLTALVGQVNCTQSCELQPGDLACQSQVTSLTLCRKFLGSWRSSFNIYSTQTQIGLLRS